MGKKQRAENDGPQQANEPTISVSELARMVRLSRASIQHYEKIGILNPDATDEHHRYPLETISRLGCAIALRNMGFEPASISPLLDDDPFSKRRLDEYLGDIKKRERYLAAQRTMLERFEELLDTSNGLGRGVLEIREIEPYYFKQSLQTTALEADEIVGKSMYTPISGGGMRFVGDDPLSPTSFHTGRTVPVRYAELIEGFGIEQDETMGGCQCLIGSWDINALSSYFISSRSLDWTGVFGHFKAFLKKHGFEATDNAFVPYDMSIYGIPRALICLPVRRTRRFFGRR